MSSQFYYSRPKSKSFTMPSYVLTLLLMLILILSTIVTTTPMKSSPITITTGCIDKKTPSSTCCSGDITIDSSVTSIADNAFKKCSITSVTIPTSVISIGNHAFSSNQITALTLGNSVKAIGNDAFRYNLLSSTAIPSSLTTIGNSAFANNTDAFCLAYVGLSFNYPVCHLNDVHEFPSNTPITIATTGCINRNTPSDACCTGDVEISSSVISIESQAFYSCSIRSVIIPSSVNYIGDNAFSFNGELSLLTLGNNVKRIGRSAFAYDKLASVTIPGSVLSIGDGAFDINNPNFCLVYLGVKVSSQYPVCPGKPVHPTFITTLFAYLIIISTSISFLYTAYDYRNKRLFPLLIWMITPLVSFIGSLWYVCSPNSSAFVSQEAYMLCTVISIAWSFVMIAHELFEIGAYPSKLLLHRQLKPYFIWLKVFDGYVVYEGKIKNKYFENHDNLGKLFTWLISWIIFVCLQLLCYVLYGFSLLLHIVYWAALLLLAAVLYSSHCLCSSAVWNTWLSYWTLSGTKFETGVKLDTAFFNRSLLAQNILHDIPMLCIIFFNGSITANIAVLIIVCCNLIFIFRYVFYSIKYGEVMIGDAPLNMQVLDFKHTIEHSSRAYIQRRAHRTKESKKKLKSIFLDILLKAHREKNQALLDLIMDDRYIEEMLTYDGVYRDLLKDFTDLMDENDSNRNKLEESFINTFFVDSPVDNPSSSSILPIILPTEMVAPPHETNQEDEEYLIDALEKQYEINSQPEEPNESE